MKTLYRLELQSPVGEPIDQFDVFEDLEWSRAFGTVGSLTVTIPVPFDPGVLRADNRLLLYRDAGAGGRLTGDTWWLARRYEPRPYGVTIYATDLISLIERRIVAYTPQTPYADKTLEEFGLETPDNTLRLDNMIRAYVRENMGALALDTARDLSAWIDIEADQNLAPHGEKQAGWAELLSTLNDLCRQAEAADYPLFFDFIPLASGRLFFRVFHNQRGVDRSATSISPVIFSEAAGNLAEVETIFDYSEEGNDVYVLGFDSASARVWTQVTDEAAVARSPFARIEFTHDAGNEADLESYLEEVGHEALAGKRPRVRVSGETIDTYDTIFGRDYDFGDKVTVETGQYQFDAYISAVRCSFGEGIEQREVRLSGSAPL